MDAEIRGSSNEALRLYRRAFRLDSNVDQAFKLEERIDSVPVISDALAQIPPANMGLAIIPPPSRGVSNHRDVIDVIIASSASDSIVFTPFEQNSSVPIQSLPTELIICILRFFSWDCDYTTLERFAAVCRKARLLTMDNSLWRYEDWNQSSTVTIH